ncbi:MAG: tRNA glutamyl-Q synthetase, partial [Rubrivivax sp.]|nr:tRNA glutamyl-Q synthetase [Pyrinomonadaceae bacterium]
MHLGHASTFWRAYERARANGGALILRSEDLDPQRSRAEFAGAMLEDLRWLGIEWSEGPDVGGAFGPYSQSARRDFYLEAWARLLACGRIYPCVCSRRDIARAAQAPHEQQHGGGGDDPVYPGTGRPRAGTPTLRADDPRGLNWRFRVPDGEGVVFDDLRQERQVFIAGCDFGDFAVW